MVVYTRDILARDNSTGCAMDNCQLLSSVLVASSVGIRGVYAPPIIFHANLVSRGMAQTLVQRATILSQLDCWYDYFPSAMDMVS